MFILLLLFSMPQLQFQYADPEKNFNRKKVAGLVAKLVRVKDTSTATAVEVAAGGKVGGNDAYRSQKGFLRISSNYLCIFFDV